MKLTASVMLILTSAWLAGCAGRNAGDFCDVASPIRPSVAAATAMDQIDKAAILKHNEYGLRVCGWE